jgi:predicted RNase H-like HicB family nuclease
MKYLVKIYWSNEDEAYVAEDPAKEGCVSHGDSYVKAARKIQEAMEAWMESAKRHGDPIPEPDLAAEDIRRVAPLLKLSKLARIAKINQHTLASKLRRKTKFTPEEAARIREALASV